MVRQFKEVENIAQKVVFLVNNRFPVRVAYLFGSYVDGNARDDSDIDIAVFADGVDVEDIDSRMDFISEIQKNTSAEVEIHLFSSNLLKEVRPSNFIGYISSRGRKIAA